jgi:hypothetical protein
VSFKVNFSADMTGMQRAIDAVSRESTRTGAQVVTLNGREFMRKIAFGTPKYTGTGRAGWTPAWRLVGLRGKPYTGKAFGAQKGKIKRYNASGSVTDDRGKILAPSITVRNDTFIAAPPEPKKRRNTKRKRSYAGGRFNYLHKANTSGKSKGWFQRAVDSVTFSFHRQHAKLMKKHSARGAK